MAHRPLPPLSCTVRDCGLVLESRGQVYACARGHAYDVAKSGYVNLLGPGDRRSLAAGDTREAVLARKRLLARGIGASVVAQIAQRVAAQVAAQAVVVDLGCGSGELLAALASRHPVFGVGIDLSTTAAEQAARQHPAITWVVGNADRRIPLLDRTVDAVVSLHGRRNAEECDRVLVRGGRLFVAFPAASDLAELRAHLHGAATAPQRSETIIAEHSRWFALRERDTFVEHHRVDRDGLHDLLRGTYRGARASSAARLAALDTMDVTVASELLVFERVSR